MDDASVESVGEPWKYNPEYHRVADYLGVNKFDREDFNTANKLSIITDWGSLKSKGKSLEEALTAVKQLQKDRGLSYVGKPLVDELYRNIRLELDSKRVREAQPVKASPKEEAKPKTKKQDVIGGIVSQAMGKDKTIQKAVGVAVQNAVQQQVAAQVQQAVKTLIK